MATANHKILIIDDEPLILSSLSAVLSEEYEVITAEEGVSGLSMFCENHPALVLLDVSMPWISGIEVLTRIREMDSEVPVFMMTGRGKTDDFDSSWTIQCAALGVNGYFVKPITPEKLLRRIERAIKTVNSEQ